MKIYTKTGDAGETGLFAGPRVRKDDPRIEAYGEVDELNTVLGLARAERLADGIDALLARIQNQLFDLGAELATPDPARRGADAIDSAAIAFLEAAIDAHDEPLAPLKTFILPGGVRGAAALHLARAVCRRAERRTITLRHTPGEDVSPLAICYLNRLSDLLFVLARYVNFAAGTGDVLWHSSRQGGES
jgi:cob(I)alamin adenosyltransferase